jgi:hypothetical protein
VVAGGIIIWIGLEGRSYNYNGISVVYSDCSDGCDVACDCDCWLLVFGLESLCCLGVCTGTGEGQSTINNQQSTINNGFSYKF